MFPASKSKVRLDFRLYDSSDLKTCLLMSWLGPDALAVVRPSRVYLFNFFSFGIQFYLLFSHYLCFISFYLDLCVLGDDALISNGYFMQTKHLCVLIYISTKGEVGAPLNRFKPSSKIFLLTVPRRWFFCGSFMLFLSCFVMLSCTSVC